MFKYNTIEKTLFKNNYFKFKLLDLEGGQFIFKLNDTLNCFNPNNIDFFLMDDFIHVGAKKNIIKNFENFDEDLEIKLLEEDISKILNILKISLNNFKALGSVKPHIKFNLKENESKKESSIRINYSFSIFLELNIHSDIILKNIKDNLIKDIIQSYSYLFNNRYIDKQDLNVFVNAFYATECVDSFISKYFDKYYDSSLEIDIFNNEFKQYISFNNNDEYSNLVELLKINYKH